MKVSDRKDGESEDFGLFLCRLDSEGAESGICTAKFELKLQNADPGKTITGGESHQNLGCISVVTSQILQVLLCMPSSLLTVRACLEDACFGSTSV